MITPENQVPLDDSSSAEADDQQSQKDIHGNGFDQNEEKAEEEQVDTATLQQAYDAAEASYTLDTDKGIEESKKD